MSDVEFTTSCGQTVLRRDAISAYTLKWIENEDDDTIDVFLTCGSVFTILGVSASDFLKWVGNLNG